MRNRTKGVITVAAILVSLAAGLTLPVFNARPSTASYSATTRSAGLPALQGGKAIQRLKEQGLYDSLQGAVEATRYGMRWEGQPALRHLPPSYFTPNPAQRFNAYFTVNGLHLAPHQTSRAASDIHHASDQPEWQAEMKLISYGYGETLLVVSPAELVAQDNRIEYLRTGQPLTEWYINKAEGLEQGFTIEAPPGVKSQGKRLRLVLELSGDLRAELAEEGRAIALRQEGGQVTLRYGDLHAYDVQGRVLQSEMKVSDGRVVLDVEEARAVYPLTIDPTFTQQQKLAASDGAAGDLFGKSVAISGDTAVVGAYGDDIGSNADQGSTYVFARSGTLWSQRQKLIASDGATYDNFGNSVAISGETVVVGTDIVIAPGSAYVFSIWGQQQKLTASDWAAAGAFGTSVAISGDTAVVGDPGNDIGSSVNQGSAYVFVRSGTSWIQQAKLTASDGAAGDYFGRSVAISGEMVVVGASGDDVGKNVDQGSAYVFVRSGTTVFVPSGATWSQQHKLIATGGSVAISGETVVAGARYDNFNKGSAYVFARSGSTWGQQKLTASDATANDYFGSSVAVDGDTIVVGAPWNDVGYNLDQGAAYIFLRKDTSWSEKANADRERRNGL